MLMIKPQTLHRKFESSCMKDEDSLNNYFNNLMEVNQMQKYGHRVFGKKIVEKILRSSSRQCEFVIKT